MNDALNNLVATALHTYSIYRQKTNQKQKFYGIFQMFLDSLFKKNDNHQMIYVCNVCSYKIDVLLFI